MQANTKRRVEDEINTWLIPFLRNQAIPMERREHVESAIKTAQIASRALLKYRFAILEIPAPFRVHIAECFSLSALMEATRTRSAAEKILPRIKQCGKCDKWFYARRYSDRFCSDNCRKLHWAGNAGKAYRAAKAQEARDREKQRGKESLRLVRTRKK